MKTRNCLLQVITVIVAACSLLGCASPGQTKANYQLQGDIQSAINANELAHGHIFGGKVVDTKVISTEGQTVTEHWIVNRGNHNVIYEIKMKPSPRGGTDFRVNLPKEDQK